MLTPQQVQAQKFVKAVFGGYDMAAVDDFLNQLGEDYSTLYKENAVLKSKLKVLVESIEEYRSVDESMRKALMSAQRMADDMVTEAKEKAAQILGEAQRDVDTRRSGVGEALRQEQQRLEHAKGETAEFLFAMRTLLARQSELIDAVPGMTFAPEARDEGERKVEEIDQSLRVAVEQQQEEAAPAVLPEEQPVGIADADATMVFDIGRVIEEQKVSDDTDPKPRFKFDDLKFGKNYDLGKKGDTRHGL